MMETEPAFTGAAQLGSNAVKTSTQNSKSSRIRNENINVTSSPGRRRPSARQPPELLPDSRRAIAPLTSSPCLMKEL